MPTTLVTIAPRNHIAAINDLDQGLVEPHHWYEVEDGRTLYAYANHQGTTIKMHRLILEATLGRVLSPGEIVDHINGNGLDNRRSNLRLATHSQNHANAPKPQKRDGRPSSSQYKGVYWHKPSQRWLAQIRLDGKKTHLGYYEDEAEAARAYDAAAIAQWGEFAKPNFP